MADPIASHGWTAVPRDAAKILGGKPYLHEPKPILVADMNFPSDNPLVERVRKHAQKELLPQTFNHSMRVYYFCKPSSR